MISPLNPLPGYTVYQPPPVEETGNDNALLPTVAVSLSENASVVATLGGAKSSTQVYTAAGLLSTLKQAGALPAAPAIPDEGIYQQGDAHQGDTQQLQNQQIAATLAQPPQASGAYTGAPLLPTLNGAPATASWANTLKARPGLASTAVANTYNQSVVSSFSTYA
ncbi:hypothetical protein GCM10027277_38910 [Pseudoduganella ginsengisoli]|uniref:Uncharacterized protein n=1 Tax=Pseudoduganella ginsengisoli TaxID=1462440 RepID=A0A6L6PYJ4_9BURK|nr:hypothetical protein [Pseudoduganella ginsengisoli]MTW02038.1 hypothetical protein [Pseudoduganella ginsengisoli]